MKKSSRQVNIGWVLLSMAAFWVGVKVLSWSIRPATSLIPVALTQNLFLFQFLINLLSGTLFSLPAFLLIWFFFRSKLQVSFILWTVIGFTISAAAVASGYMELLSLQPPDVTGVDAIIGYGVSIFGIVIFSSMNFSWLNLLLGMLLSIIPGFLIGAVTGIAQAIALKDQLSSKLHWTLGVAIAFAASAAINSGVTNYFFPITQTVHNPLILLFAQITLSSQTLIIGALYGVMTSAMLEENKREPAEQIKGDLSSE